MQQPKFILAAIPALMLTQAAAHPARAQAYAGAPALAVEKISGMLDQTTQHNGRNYCVAFTVGATQQPPAPSYGFTSPIMPKPAFSLASGGVLRIETDGAPEAMGSFGALGTAWSGMVTAHVTGYSQRTAQGWKSLAVAGNYLRWTVTVNGTEVAYSVRPQYQAARDGISDAGPRELVARLMSLAPSDITISRPTGLPDC